MHPLAKKSFESLCPLISNSEDIMDGRTNESTFTAYKAFETHGIICGLLTVWDERGQAAKDDALSQIPIQEYVETREGKERKKC